MQKDQYATFVKGRTKEPTDIHSELTVRKINLIHAAMGISGEAGELLDAIKKHVMYNKELDIENVIEELGDLEFYMQMMRSALHLDREDILKGNVEKLTERYPNRYTDQHAKARLDKQPKA